MSRRRLVELPDDLPEDEGFPVKTCNWCAGDPERQDTKSVVALEHEGGIHRYYGLCGNHAEVLNVSYEWQEIPGTKKYK